MMPVCEQVRFCFGRIGDGDTVFGAALPIAVSSGIEAEVATDRSIREEQELQDLERNVEKLTISTTGTREPVGKTQARTRGGRTSDGIRWEVPVGLQVVACATTRRRFFRCNHCNVLCWIHQACLSSRRRDEGNPGSEGRVPVNGPGQDRVEIH